MVKKFEMYWNEMTGKMSVFEKSEINPSIWFDKNGNRYAYVDDITVDDVIYTVHRVDDDYCLMTTDTCDDYDDACIKCFNCFSEQDPTNFCGMCVVEWTVEEDGLLDGTIVYEINGYFGEKESKRLAV